MWGWPYWPWTDVDTRYEESEPHPPLRQRPWRTPPKAVEPMACKRCGKECRPTHAHLNGSVLCLDCLPTAFEELEA